MVDAALDAGALKNVVFWFPGGDTDNNQVLAPLPSRAARFLRCVARRRATAVLSNG